MITLTTPAQVKTVLGGAGTVSYDKFVLSSITYDTVNKTVRAVVTVTSTASPDMTPVVGSLSIIGSILQIEVPNLDFFRRVTLTAGQTTSVVGFITSAQNSLEAGLVSLGVASGTQATGA